MECGSQQRLPPPPWKTPQSAPLALSLETPCFCWRLPSDKAAVNSCECVRVCARGRAGEGGERERGRRVQREGPTEENERDCRGRERESSRRQCLPSEVLENVDSQSFDVCLIKSLPFRLQLW